MDAKQIADRYISRGGGKRVPTQEDMASDLLTLLNFIGWHEDGDMWGGHKANEAFDALCRLFNIDRIEVRKLIRGDDRSGLFYAVQSKANHDDIPF